MVKLGDDPHAMGARTVAHDLNRAGFRAIYLSDPQDYAAISDAVAQYGARAVAFSLPSDSHLRMAADTVAYLRANGHGDIRFLGGGAITPNAALALSASGVKFMAQSGDVVDFLRISKLHDMQPSLSPVAGSPTIRMSYGGATAGAESGARIIASFGEVRVPSAISGVQNTQGSVSSIAQVSAQRGSSRAATYSEHTAALGRVMQIARQEGFSAGDARGFKASLIAASLWAPVFSGYSEALPKAGLLEGSESLKAVAAFAMAQQFAALPAYAANQFIPPVGYHRENSAVVNRTGAERLVYAIGNTGEISVVSELSLNAPHDSRQARVDLTTAGRSYVLGTADYRPGAIRDGKGALGPSMADRRATPQALTGKQGKHPHETYKQVLRSSDGIPKDAVIQASLPASHTTDDGGEAVKKKSHYLSIGGRIRKKSPASGGLGPKTGLRGTASSAHSTEGAAKRGGSLIELLMLALLGILGRAAGAFRAFDTAMRDRYTERLLLNSDRFVKMLEKEAGAFGMDLRVSGAADYYSVLGIKYTTDQKEIRRAYKELVKKHHPDVSKEIDAGQIMQKINEAYATLNGEQKQEYDKAFTSGAKGVRADDAKRISDELLGRYMKAREADFEKFRNATSAPLTADQLATVMDEVCAWSRRFDRVSNSTFKGFIKYGRSVRKLSAANRKLMSKTADAEVLLRLRENAGRLDELTRAYESVERSLSGIRKSLKKEIGAQEGEVVRKLRASVKYA